jgi:archaellum component FlaF (FlaF/FlaG flagellin family)
MGREGTSTSQLEYNIITNNGSLLYENVSPTNVLFSGTKLNVSSQSNFIFQDVPLVF